MECMSVSEPLTNCHGEPPGTIRLLDSGCENREMAAYCERARMSQWDGNVNDEENETARAMEAMAIRFGPRWAAGELNTGGHSHTGLCGAGSTRSYPNIVAFSYLNPCDANVVCKVVG